MIQVRSSCLLFYVVVVVVEIESRAIMIMAGCSHAGVGVLPRTRHEINNDSCLIPPILVGIFYDPTLPRPRERIIRGLMRLSCALEIVIH